ncbi:MAG: gliding motility-associated C-terminal domain-containing protein [Saprospiraceae bacterium]|nr:gliding motility-associated C-terminal domain-containing protein [Saprospiraceae bacterium]
MQTPKSVYVPFERIMAYCEGNLAEEEAAQIRELAAQEPLIQETIVHLQDLLQERSSQNIKQMLDHSLQSFLQQPLIIEPPITKTPSWFQRMTLDVETIFSASHIAWRKVLILGNIVLALLLGHMFYQTLVFPAEAQDTELTANDPTLLFPDGFTPNGDGVNDVFQPKLVKKVKIFREFSIYNRWGEQVYTATNFSSKSAKKAWDGTVNGEPAEAASYYYIVRLQNALGFEETFNGMLSLKR